MESGTDLSQSQQILQPRLGREWMWRTAVVALALVILGLTLYRDFVFGEKTLLYKDIGSDSINVFYPYYVLLSDYLRRVRVPSWSFSIGMGQNLYPYVGTVLITPVVWLTKGIIAKTLVYQHLLYLVIAGVLFARFLADLGLISRSSMLGAMLLSFSAYMCMGSCWYVHANEIVCFTFLLFAAEKAAGKGRWVYLVFAVAVVGLLGAFHLYLAALLLSFYVPIRLIGRHSWQPLSISRTCLVLAAAAILGVGLAAIVTMPNLYALINSPRGAGPTSAVSEMSSLPVFGFETRLHYITVCLRSFANDLLGTGDNFRGWGNYLEAPMSYCGLLCLLIVPQIFIGVTSRQRIVYGLFLTLILVPVVFPWFRYLFWAFQGDYYRAFSLFSILTVITLSMISFSRYVEGRTFNLWILGATLLILLSILYLPLTELRANIDSGLRTVITILLIGYGVVLSIGQVIGRRKLAGWIIVGMAAIELVYFNRLTIANRPTVTKQELKERVGYNDYTVEAVRDIKATDASFFRITKTWSSTTAVHDSLNDAMVFGYYGTASYSSFNNLNYIKFLMAVDSIPPASVITHTHWSRGLIGEPLLSTFACEKYVLTDNPVALQMIDAYEFVRRYGRGYLFRNRLFLPFGLTFSHYLPEDVFRQLPSWAKSYTLLHTVVLDESAAEVHGLSKLTLGELQQQIKGIPLPDTIAARRATALTISSFKETRIDGSVRLNGKSILVLQTPFDSGWRAFQDGRSARVLEVDAGLLGVVLDGGEHEVQLRYHPPLLAEGAVVSLVSLSILALSLWRWPRVRLPRSGVKV